MSDRAVTTAVTNLIGYLVTVTSPSSSGSSGMKAVPKPASSSRSNALESATKLPGYSTTEDIQASEASIPKIASELGPAHVLEEVNANHASNATIPTKFEHTISVVPQYVRGEEHVSTYRYPGISESRPLATHPTAGLFTTSSIPLPQTIGTIEPESSGPSLLTPLALSATENNEPFHIETQGKEPVRSVVIPERSTFSPPKMEWDAAR